MVTHNPTDATANTPTVALTWRTQSESMRRWVVTDQLSAWNACVSLVDARASGSIVLALRNDLSAGARGILLRTIEKHLKKWIDEGVVVYLQPKADKNALRKLRGVTVAE